MHFLLPFAVAQTFIYVDELCLLRAGAFSSSHAHTIFKWIMNLHNPMADGWLSGCIFNEGWGVVVGVAYYSKEIKNNKSKIRRSKSSLPYLCSL